MMMIAAKIATMTLMMMMMAYQHIPTRHIPTRWEYDIMNNDDDDDLYCNNDEECLPVSRASQFPSWTKVKLKTDH